MANNSTSQNTPVPRVKRRRRNISLVWFVPIVALFLGGWLVYISWVSSGPLVTISFETASGVEAGVTKIKYRDVSIGQVESVEIGPDFSSALVSARLDKQVTPYLNDSTKFWIERPRVGTSGISGLGTLFSGAHIGFEATLEGAEKRSFIGLEEPPIVNTRSGGVHVVLNAKKVGSLVAGGPVYYKSFKVGAIESVRLNEELSSVIVKAFIGSPYDKLVHADSRFWNVSGVSAEINSEGISVNLQSFESLLIGGIEFDSPSLGKKPQPVDSYHEFQLFDSFQHLGVQDYAHKLFYIVNFNQSIRGLNVNAPVEYRGLKIGRVVNISSRYNKTQSQILLPVLLEIEPERLGIIIEDDFGVESAHEEIIDLGLFAKLENANLITGQLYVSLDSYDDEEKTVLTDFEGFKQLPTVSTDLNRIAANLGAVLEKVNDLKLEPLIENLNASVLILQDTLENAGTFIDNSDSAVKKVVISLSETLEKSQKLLITGEQMFGRGHAVMQSLEEGSTTRYKLDQTLKELQSAARSLNTLLETIEKNPNSLIFGKQKSN